MLGRGGGDGVRGGEGGAFEIGGGEVGDAVADGGAELGEGLLDLGGVVVCLGLVDLGDPGRGETDDRGMSNGGWDEKAHLRRARWTARRLSTRASRSLYSTRV